MIMDRAPTLRKMLDTLYLISISIRKIDFDKLNKPLYFGAEASISRAAGAANNILTYNYFRAAGRILECNHIY